MLKTEIESAINGKQWLLSCFGPFKESTTVPNLIDRSFEEVRLNFLEASKSGNAQQHVNELIAQYNDAMGKLNQLKMASPETIQLISNIYNQSVQDQKTAQTNPSSSNIFASSNTSSTPQTQNPFQLSNVFGGTQTQQTPALNVGSIFGGAPANSNPFQVASQNSIFGGTKDQQTLAPQPESSFTFSLSQQTPQQSVFGMSQQSAPQSNIFGGTQSIQQPQQQLSSGSIFGGQSTTFGSSSVFGAPQQQQQQIQQTQQQQQQQTGSIFGSSIFAQTQLAASGNFGSPLQIPPQTSTFSQPATNIFGGFQTTQPDPAVQSSGNVFAQPQQNIFSMQQTAPAPQSSLPTAPGAIFQIQQSATNTQQTFGGNPFQSQPPPVDENAYSKPEDLTPDELQAFQAEMFQVGSIPFKPPSKHLCI